MSPPASVCLAARVHPRASRARLRWDGVRLELWVTAPAVEGAANRAVVEAVAEWAGVRAGAVRVIRGEGSRSKIVEIEGLAKTPSAPP